MTKPTVLDSAARAEIKEAELYYDDRRPGLGERFHEAVYAALASLEKHPNAAPMLEPSKAGFVIRGARVWRFPYRIVYVELPGEFRVVAVAHMKRRPGYWRARLPKPPAE